MLNPFLVVSYVFIGVPQFLHLYFEKACIVVAVQCSNLKFITSSHINLDEACILLYCKGKAVKAAARN